MLYMFYFFIKKSINVLVDCLLFSFKYIKPKYLFCNFKSIFSSNKELLSNSFIICSLFSMPIPKPAKEIEKDDYD